MFPLLRWVMNKQVYEVGWQQLLQLSTRELWHFALTPPAPLNLVLHLFPAAFGHTMLAAGVGAEQHQSYSRAQAQCS